MALIYCPDCGKECSSEAASCPHCGRPVYHSYQQAPRPILPPPPKNWLVKAILVTVLCCLPFGIVALVYSSRMDSAWCAGQQEMAQQAADNAKKWVIAGLATGVGVTMLYVIFMIVVQIAAFSL